MPKPFQQAACTTQQAKSWLEHSTADSSQETRRKLPGILTVLCCCIQVVRIINVVLFWPILARIGSGIDLSSAATTAWSGIRGFVAAVPAHIGYIKPQRCMQVVKSHQYLSLLANPGKDRLWRQFAQRSSHSLEWYQRLCLCSFKTRNSPGNLDTPVLLCSGSQSHQHHQLLANPSKNWPRH